MKLIPRWNGLSLIGKSKIIKLTMLAPFIGYLILFNNELANYFVLSAELIGASSEVNIIDKENISRLYYLYYGLITLGVSSILFSIFCPAVIKDHENEFNYINSEVQIFTTNRVNLAYLEISQTLPLDSEEYKSFEKIVKKYNSSKDDAVASFKGGMSPEFDFQGVVNEKKSNESKAYTDMLNLYWDLKNTSGIALRLIILVMYILGFVLVLIPSINVFWKVLVLTLGS